MEGKEEGREWRGNEEERGWRGKVEGRGWRGKEEGRCKSESALVLLMSPGYSFTKTLWPSPTVCMRREVTESTQTTCMISYCYSEGGYQHWSHEISSQPSLWVKAMARTRYMQFPAILAPK